MDKKTFNKGIDILKALYTTKKFDSKILWDLLEDIDDVAFIQAIKEVANTVPELYPTTNIVAVIRGKISKTRQLN